MGNHYGVNDYAIFPIGAYAPREPFLMSHTTPEEAVLIDLDARTKTLIASHRGTISNLSD